MNLLTGMSDIKKLSAKKHREFDLFYHFQINHKLRPAFSDLSLLSVIVGALFYISMLMKQGVDIHPLNYVYCLLLVTLGVAHRIRSIRQAAPLMVYLIFTTVSLFSYLHFLTVGGGIKPIFGLFFFLSSLGFITISIKHTLIILWLNSLLLSLACALLFDDERWGDEVFSILTNWFVFMCMLIAPVAALFSRWLFSNLYAMQFLLNDKNELLRDTFKTLKTTEDQLIHAQKHQALNHMAKGLLHEIINPVNISTQALGFVKSLNHDEDIAEALDEVLSQQLRISDIVTELRDFARPQEEQILENVNLKVLVEKAIKFCHRELALEAVDVQLNIDDTQIIYCHPTALTQVFVNLLVNACAAFKLKRFDLNSAPKVWISSFVQQQTLRIRFKDNGAGIESGVLEHITEPFYSDQASPDKLGLGLTICQTIMRHHGGRIDIKSKVNEWTEITLTIPDQPSL
jgi:two-component system sensor histidine kinase PhcS